MHTSLLLSQNPQHSGFLIPIWLKFLCLVLILSACTQEKESKEFDSIPIAVDSATVSLEGSRLFSVGFNLIRNSPMPEDVQRGIDSMNKAKDNFLLIGQFDSAYNAASIEIAGYTRLTQYEQGILVLDEILQYPLPREQDALRAKAISNTVPSFAETHFPEVANGLLDTVISIHEWLLSTGDTMGVGPVLFYNAHLNQGNVKLFQGKYAREAGLAMLANTHFELAFRKLRIAKTLLHPFPPNAQRSQRANIHNSMGLLHYQMNELDSAMHYHQLAVSERLPNGKDGTDEENLGHVWFAKGQYKTAIQQFKQAISIQTEGYGMIPHLSELQVAIGRSYALQNEHKQALDAYKQAAIYLDPAFESSSYFDNPKPEEVSNPILYLSLLKNKNKSLWHIIERDSLTQLLQLLPTFEAAFGTINLIRKQQFNDEVIFMLSSISQELTNDFLSLNQQLNKLTHNAGQRKGYFQLLNQVERIIPDSLISPKDTTIGHWLPTYIADLTLPLQFIDHSRANSLLEGIRMSELGKVPQLSTSLQKAELQLSGKIRTIREDIFELKVKKSSPELIQDSKIELANLMAQQDSLIEVIRVDHPNYYTFRYHREAGNNKIEMVQDILNSDQMLLEYFWGDSMLYLFKITPDSYELITQPVDELATWIAELYTYIKYPVPTEDGKSFRNDFASYAHLVYNKLLQPAIPDTVNPYNRIIIIPDGDIAFVPFGALLSNLPPETAELRNMDFAIKTSDFSYAFSIEVLAHQNQSLRKKSFFQKDVLAIAPFVSNSPEMEVSFSDNHSPLYSSRKEIELFQPDNNLVLTGASASLPAFYQHAKKCRFWHISSHAFANNEFPDSSAVIFFPHETEAYHLLSKDISQFPASPEMVVLSACETGLGKLVSGEGLMSLARSFSIAGAKSVVASLWSVNDASTAQLMKQYYAALEGTDHKDQAISQAQRDVLMGTEYLTTREAHPHFWAAFTVIGNIAPVEISHNRFTDTGIIIGVFIILVLSSWLFFLFFKRIRGNTQLP